MKLLFGVSGRRTEHPFHPLGNERNGMTTAEFLVGRYGPLLTRAQVAGVLDRSPEGLRLTERGSSVLGQQLRAARVKSGRRVHFRAVSIAALLDDAGSSVQSASGSGTSRSSTGGSNE